MNENELTYFVFNGQSSLDFGLAVRERAPYTAPERNIDLIERPGQNGALMLDKGTFKLVTEELPVYLFAKDRSKRNLREEATELFNWLKSPNGWCELYYSDDPYHLMQVHIASELSFNEVFYLFYVGEGTLPFTRKPERWNTDGLAVREITKKGDILYNPELFRSAPSITVYGSGDITLYINNQTVVLKGITSPITLDAQMQNSYTKPNGVITPANSSVLNPIPTLDPGDNVFDWIGNVTKIEVIPRWWTI